MATFHYEATDENGELKRGEWEARDVATVIEHLEKKHLIPIAVTEQGKERRVTVSGFLDVFGSVNALDRISFVRTLAATLKAGLTLLESLDILVADTTKPKMREILDRTRSNLENGQPLSATFRSFGKTFPPFFVGMVRAGEASGHLDTVLDDLSVHLTKEYNLSKKVQSAFAYPIFLLIASAGVVSLLLFFILPRLSTLFASSGIQLPLITRILVATSKVFIFSPVLDVILLVGLIWFFLGFRKTVVGQRLFAETGMRIPVVRDLMKKVALVRFTRTLSSLLAGGIPIVEALQLSAESAGNVLYKKAVLASLDQVKSGVALSKALEPFPELFPRFLRSLMSVGEKTGTMSTVLKSYADFTEDDVDQTLKTLTTFLEPILLLIMGFIIGAVALSIVLPIYQLVGSFV